MYLNVEKNTKSILHTILEHELTFAENCTYIINSII